MATPLLLRVNPHKQLWIRAWFFLRVAVFFQLTCIGWLLFRADSMSDVALMAGALAAAAPLADGMHLIALWGWILLLLAPVAIIEIAQERQGDMFAVKRWPRALRLPLYTLLVGMIWSAGVKHGTEFIYFQF